MEKSDYNGKYVLPLTMSEVVTHHLYSKDPRKVRDMIVGQHSQGLNKLLQTGEMINTMLKEVFTDVNLYDDHIRLMQYPFPSPIGRTAISFYHFYIQDTVQVAGDSCYHLRFYPANQQDFGFTGDLYVLEGFHAPCEAMCAQYSQEERCQLGEIHAHRAAVLAVGQWRMGADP